MRRMSPSYSFKNPGNPLILQILVQTLFLFVVKQELPEKSTAICFFFLFMINLLPVLDLVNAEMDKSETFETAL